MKLFTVFKEGVFRHECAGIYDSIELATVAANTFCENDADGYHSWDVVEFELNKHTHIEGDCVIENNAIYTVRKK